MRANSSGGLISELDSNGIRIVNVDRIQAARGSCHKINRANVPKLPAMQGAR